MFTVLVYLGIITAMKNTVMFRMLYLGFKTVDFFHKPLHVM